MRAPPALWSAYCRILGLPVALGDAWWQALARSRCRAARVRRETFIRLSQQRAVDAPEFLQQICGPRAMAALVDQLVREHQLPGRQAEAVRTSIGNFTALEVREDWRGVAIPRLRWFTEDEAKERCHGKDSGQRRV